MDNSDLEKRIANIETVILGMASICKEHMPPELQLAINELSEEFFEANYSFGGFKSLGFNTSKE